MNHPVKNRAFWLALLMLAASIVALGQSTLGKIIGTVRDQSGAVVSGAKVTVSNELTGQTIQVVTSSGEGVFTVPQLTAGSYGVKIEASGFKTGSYTEVKVDPGKDYSLDATLEVGGASEVVQVQAGADLVNTSSPEVTNTVTRRQIVDLPLNGRNPIELVRLQAGVVGLPTRTATSINGGRPTWTQLTQDGINIQDNFIRVNALDFVPNRPTSDTIGEFTITTNTQGADSAGGASQVKLVTPSGTSEFHGSLYEFNRNSALSANSWFNNRSGVARPFLNRNQFGGNLAGPIPVPKNVFGPLGGWNDNKDKLFFFFTYEGFRQRTQTTQNNTIPANADYVNGVFRYVRPSDNTVQAINVLNVLPGLSLDPAIKQLILDRVRSASLVNNFYVGNSTTARLLNTAGYRFNQSDKNDRDQYAFRLDYQATTNHRFEFIHQRMKETDDRTDLDVINQRPEIFTSSPVKLIVGAWRWTATPKLNNELRVGVNLAPVAFESTEDYSGRFLANATNLVTSLGVIYPENTFLPQGRDTRTRQYIDNASYVTGNHAIQFGGSLQQIRVNPYNFAGIYQTYTTGFSASVPASLQLTAANFPGSSISAADLAAANALRAFLGGQLTSSARVFQVQDKTSGYISGIANDRNFTFDNWSFYAQDNWRLRPNLSVRLGLKWEYFSPLKEDADLQLLPVVNSGGARQALLDPNGRLDFVNGDFYKKDLNNFGPSVGFAWDPFKDGKTSVRGGYTLTFVNEDTLTVARAVSNLNSGLQTTRTLTGLNLNFANAAPEIAPPTFLVPRSYADQIALSQVSTAATIDNNIKQPYVHQISFSIEREIGWNTAVEARYVGTLGRDIWRGIDFNQPNAIRSDFFQDFLRARNNGYLALAQPGGVFNPDYNPAIPGSQQLSVINSATFAGGSLTNATVRSLIQQSQLAGLANFYLNGTAGAAVATLARSFFYANGGNPGIYSAQLTTNGGKTDYHGLQLEVRRRFSSGLYLQANYTFSKTLTNSTGTAQNRFEPFLDNNRPELDNRRADFDVTHILNANFIYELPFGAGKRYLSGGGVLDRVVGGWQIGSIIHAQSGAPISITSNRQTFNVTGLGTNRANSTLTREQIKNLFGIRKLADGRVFYIDPAVTDPATGRAVGPDNVGNTAGFSGQVFFNPNAGEIGQLQLLQFDGPSQTSWDFSVIKRTRISETKNIEFRADLFNFLNHPLFFVGDYDINSATFGRITQLNFGARVTQLALKFNF
jgi:hypothetical protein